MGCMGFTDTVLVFSVACAFGYVDWSTLLSAREDCTAFCAAFWNVWAIFLLGALAICFSMTAYGFVSFFDDIGCT